MTRIIALDTETTGVDARNDRIIDLAVLELDHDLNELEGRRWRFNPGIPIPPEATLVHGIRDADVQHAPPFRDHAQEIQQLLLGSAILAYNGLRFDVPCLNSELRRAGQPGLPPMHPVIDPYIHFVRDQPRHLAAAVRHYLGTGHENAHDALSDARAAAAVARQQWQAWKAPAALFVCVPRKKWLDWDHRFFEDDRGVVRFDFGKHRGQAAVDHPLYLQWMLGADMALDTKQVARDVLRDVIGAAA